MARTARHSWLGIRMRMPLVEPSRLDSLRAAWWHAAVGRPKKRELRGSANRQQRLEHFNSHVYGHVEGWLGDRMWQIVKVIGTILETHRGPGKIAAFRSYTR